MDLACLRANFDEHGPDRSPLTAASTINNLGHGFLIYTQTKHTFSKEIRS